MFKGKRGYLENINILFHHEYYDGIISGIGDIDKYKVYFTEIQKTEMEFSYYEPESDSPYLNKKDAEYGTYHDMIRFYYVYDISPVAMSNILKQQEYFEFLIGTHTQYKNNTRINIGCVNPNYAANWPVYEEKIADLKVDYKVETVFENRIGWFDTNSYIRGKSPKPKSTNK